MSRSFSRYQVILLATTVLAGPLGVANAKVVPVPTYKLGLQEGAGAVTFVSGSSSPLSWGTITKSKAFGDFSKVSAQAAFPTTYPGQLTLTEYIMQSTKTSKILNLFEEAYNLVYTGNNVGVIPSFVGPSSFASDPVTGDSGLPAGWTLTDKLYFSSTNAKLGTSGNATSGLTYEGSVTFESNADGIVTETGDTLKTPKLTSDLYSVVLETSVNAPTMTGATIGSTFTASVGTVPEPSTWAMLAIGFAGLGFAGFRKSRAPRVVVD